MLFLKQTKHWSLTSSPGFTLIELVIVIGILAILAVFVLAVVNPVEQFAKARDAQRKADLGQIQKSLEQYYQDNGRYPANNGSYQITDVNGQAVPWGGASGWNPYMNLVPSDPLSTHTYIYYSTGQTYWLYASIERGKQDSQSCNKGASCGEFSNPPTPIPAANKFPNANSCGKGNNAYLCNYGVSSPNTTP